VNSPRLRFAYAIATWFGCGRSPWAPGTAGSAAAVAIAFVLHRYAGFAPWHFAL
jgi:phosphatidylglycerophosphatase A